VGQGFEGDGWKNIIKLENGDYMVLPIGVSKQQSTVNNLTQ